MPKNIHTPRDELICGKLDKARQSAEMNGDVFLCNLLDDIRRDAERMEAKLVSRKDEASRSITPETARLLVEALKTATRLAKRDIHKTCYCDKGHSQNCETHTSIGNSTLALSAAERELEGEV